MYETQPSKLVGLTSAHDKMIDRRVGSLKDQKGGVVIGHRLGGLDRNLVTLYLNSPAELRVAFTALNDIRRGSVITWEGR